MVAQLGACQLVLIYHTIEPMFCTFDVDMCRLPFSKLVFKQRPCWI